MSTSVQNLVLFGVLAVTGSVSAQTAGCGLTPPSQPRAGSTSSLTITVGGLSRSYRVHRPKGHAANSEKAPVVFSYHGWGSSSSFNEGYMGLTSVSDSKGFFAVYPEGRSDYNSNGNNNGWQSFNAVGSTETRSGAPECTSSTNGYCYNSCSSRPQGCGKCDWTSCADDSAFTAAVLDHLEATYCVDLDRIFATGYSNGGMMVFELGFTLSSRFAALVPGGGQPFVGHNDVPDIGLRGGYLSVMDLHGTKDRTCPGNSTTSSDGWNYEPVDNVLKVWAGALDCSGTSTISKYDTPEDGDTQLYCVSFGSCPTGIDVVRCSYNLGHHWLGYSTNGGAGARLAWWFFENHPKVGRKSLNHTIGAAPHQNVPVATL